MQRYRISPADAMRSWKISCLSPAMLLSGQGTIHSSTFISTARYLLKMAWQFSHDICTVVAISLTCWIWSVHAMLHFINLTSCTCCYWMTMLHISVTPNPSWTDSATEVQDYSHDHGHHTWEVVNAKFQNGIFPSTNRTWCWLTVLPILLECMLCPCNKWQSGIGVYNL